MSWLHRKGREHAASAEQGPPGGISEGMPMDWEALGRMASVEDLERKVIEQELEKHFTHDRALLRALLYPVHAVAVDKVDTGTCENLIDAIIATDRVRPAQGHIAFMFPDHMQADEIFLVPEVRRYVRALHERVPNLLYFLAPDPVLGQFIEFAAAFSPDGSLAHVGGQIAFELSEEYLQALYGRLVIVWRFAEHAGDDAEGVVRRICQQAASASQELQDDLVAMVARAAVD